MILYRQANREIDQRKKAEEALRKAHSDLEKRVEERTTDLKKSVNELQREIVERKRAEEALRGSEAIIRNVNIKTILGRSLTPVSGDRIHLQQVIINFILNASEAITDVYDAPRKIIISTI